jgi:hypothetical protein
MNGKVEAKGSGGGDNSGRFDSGGSHGMRGILVGDCGAGDICL